MQRLRDALRLTGSNDRSNSPFRPNELRLDVARAERLRREMQRGEPSPGRLQPSFEEQRPRRELALPREDSSLRQVAVSTAGLKTRTGLRQAWLLKEILAPPLALRRPLDRDSDR